MVPDVETEEALADSEDLHEYRRSRLSAVQSTPLVVDDGRVVGMISTHWRTPHEPSAAELCRIDSLARRCAAAVARDGERPGVERPLGPYLLHEVNQRIREMAGRFDSLAADHPPQAYVCERGCGGWVSLTDGEFDARLAAEQPVTILGHLVMRAEKARRLSRTLRNEAAGLRAEALQKRRKSGELPQPEPRQPSE